MRLDKRKHMEVRHIQGLVLLVAPIGRVSVLLNRYLLNPTDRIETPILKVRFYALFDPTDLVISIFFLPNVFILRIPKCCGIKMI